MLKLRSAKLAATAVAAFAAVIATSAMAQANDLSPSGSVWDGFYVGITGGYAFGEADVKGDFRRDYLNPASQLVSEEGKGDLDGGMIGGLVGFDYALGNGIVIGAVGDLSWLGASGTADVEPSIINLTGSDYDVDTSVSWLGTLRGRIGFELGDALIYGTGGLAFGGVEAELHENTFGNIGSDSSTQIGWTLGAGINYMATDHLMLGLEYLYVDLGEGSYDFSGAGNADVDVNMSIVRGTLGYKF